MKGWVQTSFIIYDSTCCSCGCCCGSCCRRLLKSSPGGRLGTGFKSSIVISYTGG